MPTMDELLNQPLPHARTPEPQDSPKPGEAEKPAEQTPSAEKAAETPPAVTEQPKPGEQPNGATPAPKPEEATEEVRQARAFQKAAEDERRKRQTLEQTVEELKRFNAELQQRMQAPAQTPEYLDPEGAQHLQGQFNAAFQQQQAALVEFKVVQSQELMRGRHTDYDEIEKVFADAAQVDQTLWQKLYQHPLPAQFAYQEGKKIKAMNEIGSDPDAYRKKLMDEIREQVKAELQPAQPQQQPQTPTAPSPPPSLVSVPSAGTREPGWQGPTPLDNLLTQPLPGSRRR